MFWYFNYKITRDVRACNWPAQRIFYSCLYNIHVNNINKPYVWYYPAFQQNISAKYLHISELCRDCSQWLPDFNDRFSFLPSKVTVYSFYCLFFYKRLWASLVTTLDVPLVATSLTLTPFSCAMKPRMEKMTNPAKKLVPQFTNATINVSLGTVDQHDTNCGFSAMRHKMLGKKDLRLVWHSIFNRTVQLIWDIRKVIRKHGLFGRSSSYLLTEPFHR